MGFYVIFFVLYFGLCGVFSYVLMVAFEVRHFFLYWLFLWILIVMAPAWDFVPVKLLMERQCKADAGAHIYETRSNVDAYEVVGISISDPKRMVVSSRQKIGNEYGRLVYTPMQQKAVLLQGNEIPVTKYQVLRSHTKSNDFWGIKKETISIYDKSINKKIATFVNYEKWAAPFHIISSNEFYGMTPFAYLSMGDCFNDRYFRLWYLDGSEASKERIIYKMVDEVLKNDN